MPGITGLEAALSGKFSRTMQDLEEEGEFLDEPEYMCRVIYDHMVAGSNPSVG